MLLTAIRAALCHYLQIRVTHKSISQSVSSFFPYHSFTVLGKHEGDNWDACMAGYVNHDPLDGTLYRVHIHVHVRQVQIYQRLHTIEEHIQKSMQEWYVCIRGSGCSHWWSFCQMWTWSSSSHIVSTVLQLHIFISSKGRPYVGVGEHHPNNQWLDQFPVTSGLMAL